MSNFFTDLFSGLDTATTNLGAGMSNVLNIVMPVFGAVFVVYVMFIVWSYWQNGASIEGLAIDAVKRIIGLGLIIGLGINYATYSSTVFPFVTDLGDGLAHAWGGSTDTGSQLDAIVEKVAQITDTNSMDAETAIDNEIVPDGALTPPKGIIDSVMGAVSDATGAVFDATIGKLGNNLMALGQNIIIYISSAIFLVVAAAYLLVAQVMLILLAAIGPVFFGFAIFPATRQFFTNWIRQVLNYGFLFLIITVTGEIFISYIDAQLDTATAGYMAGEFILGASTMLQLIAMFVVFAVMLLQVPSLTAGLFGGLAVGGFSGAYSTARNILSTNRGVGSSKPKPPTGGEMEGKQ